MPRPANYHQIPKPSSEVSARNRLESGALDEKTLSRLWRPRAGSLLEVMLSTISRVSLRLIDRVTGDAYSADELEAKILEAVAAGADPAWEDISGKPTTLAGYGITDAAAANHSHTITRTAEQGPPASYPTQVTVSGSLTNGTNPITFPTLLYAGMMEGRPCYTNDGVFPDTDPSESNLVYFTDSWFMVHAGTLGSWRVVSTDTIPPKTGWVVTGPATGTATLDYENPTIPAAPGQLCIVDDSDVYIAAKVSPPIWIGPLNQ